MEELPLETDCHQVLQLLNDQESFLLLDCREAQEHTIASINGAQLLPMSEIQSRQQELAGKEAEHVVVFCHHGMRSAQVANWLRQQGFTQAQSMAGGIDRWSLEVDPSITRY